MDWFWRLCGLRSFNVEIGDRVRLEIQVKHPYDDRKIIKKYAEVTITSITLDDTIGWWKKMYHYNFEYSSDLRASSYIAPAVIWYHPTEWGGMKPLKPEKESQDDEVVCPYG